MEIDKILKTLYKIGSTLYDPVPRPENNEGMSDEAQAVYLAISILERVNEERIEKIINEYSFWEYDNKGKAQAIVRELKGE
jgi:hypothetical protein